ncbi:DUF1446 domain-containing protein [Oscillibacter sp. MSJ-2]|uniref:DUF1446 domain-containing protein n=1 Tax=Dysosmobacter acutus TaxID=2841504 RepID=A0ABS6F9R1_9FIRM|nr:acyclic terpene utilization AtuA family protein [Dysosmobacter acutus]MBU5627023.1 DUF1446 domain-containing protein [Dysosmobacter acutus]
MTSCKIFVPVGACGGGIHDDAFEMGMAMNPDCIAMDAGSTDSGPAYLANGVCKYSEQSIAHDLELSIVAAVEHNIPLFIGSCGTCGTDSSLAHFAEIAEQIIVKHGYHIKIATISSQMDPHVLEKKWDEGKIHALPGAPEITRDVFASCQNIVGLMGAEPFIEAYRSGAQIVLGGRATDTGVIAAFGLMNGMNEGACWHGAKVVECGPQCTDTAGVCVMLELDHEGFTVYPTDPAAHCTPYTVSAHLLYENTNPFRLTEPGGSFITDDAVYTQLTPQATRVTGSRFERAGQYTMKLEGSRLAGYQNISLVGVADRDILRDLDSWIGFMRSHVQAVLDKHGFDRSTYSFDLRCFGHDAVVPLTDGENFIPREVGLLLSVTADTQEIATGIAKDFNPYLLHLPKNYQSAKDLLPTFAFPFSPVDTPRGPVYEFVLHHVVDVDDPLELVRINYKVY